MPPYRAEYPAASCETDSLSLTGAGHERGTMARSARRVGANASAEPGAAAATHHGTRRGVADYIRVSLSTGADPRHKHQQRTAASVHMDPTCAAPLSRASPRAAPAAGAAGPTRRRHRRNCAIGVQAIHRARAPQAEDHRHSEHGYRSSHAGGSPGGDLRNGADWGALADDGLGLPAQPAERR